MRRCNYSGRCRTTRCASLLRARSKIKSSQFDEGAPAIKRAAARRRPPSSWRKRPTRGIIAVHRDDLGRRQEPPKFGHNNSSMRLRILLLKWEVGILPRRRGIIDVHALWGSRTLLLFRSREGACSDAQENCKSNRVFGEHDVPPKIR